MFFFGRRREGSDRAALEWMSKTFNEEYPKKGMLFCVGNMAKRPQTWQLLGVLRVDDTGQGALFRWTWASWPAAKIGTWFSTTAPPRHSPCEGQREQLSLTI